MDGETPEDPYCWYCAGYGYHQLTETSSASGYLQCTHCNGRQRRPKADYAVHVRALIMKDYPKQPPPPKPVARPRRAPVSVVPASSRRKPIATKPGGTI